MGLNAQVDARGGLLMGAKKFIGAALTQRSAVLRAVGIVSVDPPSLATQASGTYTVNVTNNANDFIEGAVGDLIFLVPPNTLEDGLVVHGAAFTAKNVVIINIGNLDTITVDGAARDWAYLVFSMS